VRTCQRIAQGRNLSEVLLWKRINKGRFKGYDFDRQKIIGNYIVDFYCVYCRAVIEIDGKSHETKKEYDSERNAFLVGLGLAVIHIDANNILERIDNVMFWLYDHPALRAPLQGGE
jgi:very-short-patch-repair endonuclease